MKAALQWLFAWVHSPHRSSRGLWCTFTVLWAAFGCTVSSRAQSQESGGQEAYNQCGSFTSVKSFAADSSIYVEKARIWLDSNSSRTVALGYPTFILTRARMEAGPSASFADSTNRAVGAVRGADGNWQLLVTPESFGKFERGHRGPVLEMAEDGTSHMFWMRAREGAPLARTDTVFHAEFRAGRWSEPEPILVASAMRWDHSVTNAVVKGDTVFLAVHFMGRDSGFHIVRGSRRPSTVGGGWDWSTIRVGIPVFVGYATLGVDSDQELTLGVIGMGSGSSGSNANVYVTRSREWGGAWEMVVPLDSVDTEAQRHYPVSHEVPGRGQVLLWGVRGEGGEDSVVVYLRPTGSGAWRHLSTVSVRGFIVGMTSEVSADRVLHVVIRREGKSPLGLSYRHSGVRAETLPIKYMASQPRLTRLPDGSLLLAWGMTRVVNKMIGPFLVRSVLVPCTEE